MRDRRIFLKFSVAEKIAAKVAAKVAGKVAYATFDATLPATLPATMNFKKNRRLFISKIMDSDSRFLNQNSKNAQNSVIIENPI